MATSHSKQTFGERYQNAHHLLNEQCAEHLFGRSLHAPLRWVWPIAKNFCRFHFQEERLHFQTIMQLRSLRALNGELAELFFQPENRKLHRRLFRTRVSTRRARRLLKTLPDS